MRNAAHLKKLVRTEKPDTEHQFTEQQEYEHEISRSLPGLVPSTLCV